MKTFIEGLTIWLIFIFAAVMDGQLDGIEQFKEFRQTFDMALFWAIQEGLKWV